MKYLIGDIPGFLIALILLAAAGVIVLGVIIAKKFIKPLQIQKPDISEEQAIQEELDRVLVPVEDEDIQKQMDEAAKHEGE